MKTYRFNHLLIFVALLTMVGVNAKAQVLKGLPGTVLRTADAAKQADLIVIGKIKDLGLTAPKGDGELIYSDVKIDSVKVLKGKIAGPIVAVMRIKEIEGVIEELAPKIDIPYIVFISIDKKTKLMYVTKILENDEKAIAEVVSAIDGTH